LNFVLDAIHQADAKLIDYTENPTNGAAEKPA
jgi:hypothetical protein